MIEEVAIIMGAIAAILTAIWVIYYKGIRPLFRWAKRAHSMYAAVALIEERSRQLDYNGGSHMRDDIREIRKSLEGHIEFADERFRHFDAENVRLWRHMAGAESGASESERSGETDG